MMKPVTEEANPNTKDIDRLSTIDVSRLINHRDKFVAEAISRVLGQRAERVVIIKVLPG